MVTFRELKLELCEPGSNIFWKSVHLSADVSGLLTVSKDCCRGTTALYLLLLLLTCKYISV